MGRAERVAKLEALLTRVQTRGAEPRPRGGSVAVLSTARNAEVAREPVRAPAPAAAPMHAPPQAPVAPVAPTAPVAAAPPPAAHALSRPATTPFEVPKPRPAPPPVAEPEPIELASIPPDSMPPDAPTKVMVPDVPPPAPAPVFEPAPAVAAAPAYEPPPAAPAFDAAAHEAPAFPEPTVPVLTPHAGMEQAPPLHAAEPSPLQAAMAASVEQGPSRDALERAAAREAQDIFEAPQPAQQIAMPAAMAAHTTVPPQQIVAPTQASSGRGLRTALIILLWVFALAFLAYALWSTHVLST